MRIFWKGWEDIRMNGNEKIYHTVKNAGIWNLVMGIVVLVTGVTSGVLLLVNAFKLIKSKHELMI